MPANEKRLVRRDRAVEGLDRRFVVRRPERALDERCSYREASPSIPVSIAPAGSPAASARCQSIVRIPLPAAASRKDRRSMSPPCGCRWIARRVRAEFRALFWRRSLDNPAACPCQWPRGGAQEDRSGRRDAELGTEPRDHRLQRGDIVLQAADVRAKRRDLGRADDIGIRRDAVSPERLPRARPTAGAPSASRARRVSAPTRRRAGRRALPRARAGSLRPPTCRRSDAAARCGCAARRRSAGRAASAWRGSPRIPPARPARAARCGRSASRARRSTRRRARARSAGRSSPGPRRRWRRRSDRGSSSGCSRR